ncbi:hypothetical protein FJZ19_04305 [Candidatus Pacearchaeota archaeon]|nr:hypothetical protein [Candidatus Pacearchaeota archaeon]
MNAKRGFIACILLLSLLECYSVAASLGVGPASTYVNFQPNINFSVNFFVRGPAPEQKIGLYATGDLKEYVEFDKTNMTGPGTFSITVRLPDKISKVGKNRLIIGAKEIGDEEISGIGTALAVEVLVEVFVPYPGKYAEISSFSVNDINLGEPINFQVDVANLGEQNITASVYVDIYGANKSKIETLNLGLSDIATQTKKLFKKILNTSNYNSGFYKAVATLNYGANETKIEKTFKIGGLFVNITNWTSEFEAGKLNKFDIQIESFWNDKVSNIFAEVNITDKNNALLDTFKTPSVSLSPWQKTNLSGYFNAEKIKAGIYKADISIFYEDKTTRVIADIEVKEKKGLNFVLIVLISAAVVLFIAALIYFFLRKNAGKKKRK